MTGLKITTGKPQVVLPEGAETRSYGMLGMRGSGKSNAAVVLAEEFHRQGVPWIALDPKGDWWGIKSSADGRGPGLPVVVFGGPHADVALEPTAAAGVELADVLVSEGLTCIIDISSWTKSGRIEFLAGLAKREGFLERLYLKHLPEHGTCHLFMEEAHNYLPQQALREVGKLIEVASKFQTEGRNRGWGCSVISQRSARVHNDVLTQIDTLLAFRTIASVDREAIEKWVKYHGVARELVASLPELEDGECWLWSPEWLRKVLSATGEFEAGIRRLRFRRRETFDSGATPVRRKAGAKPRRVVLADVDLKALEKRMATAVEKAKDQDPEYLQKEIRRLKAELGKRPTETKVEERVEEVRVEVPIFRNGEVAALTKAVDRLGDVGALLQAVGTEVREASDRVATTLEGARNAGKSPAPRPRPTSPRPTGTQRPPRTRERASTAPTPAPEPVLDGDFRPTSGHQKILNALAWWEAVGFPRCNRTQVGFIAGYRPGKRGGGHFGNLLGNLRTAGLVDYPAPALICLTDAGREMADIPDLPQSPEGFQNAVLSMLTAGHRRILEILIEDYPESVAKDELAERAGYSAGDRGGGHFGNLLGNLRTFGLVDYPSPGYVAALAVLFLEAVPA